VGITILSSLPFTVIFWKLQADEQYGTILWMRLLNNGSTIIAFTVLLLLDKFTLESALLWNLITNSLTSIIGLLARLGGIKHIFSRTRLTIIEIVHFGKYSLATNLSSNLLGSANTYIINFMLGTGAVAILSVPSRLMELVEIPLRSFVGTGMSSMATAYNQKDTNRVISLLNKYSGMLTIAFIPLTLGVLLLADIPVNILSSGKYRGTEAANLYRLIMVIALIYPIDRFNGVTLDIIHQPRINFQKVQLMLVVKIAATFGCVYMLNSIYGVPLSGLITQVAGLAYGHYRLKQHLKVSIPEMLKVGIAETRQLTARILRRK
jgi:O-antigen/teichoic acid export membrane protein